MKNERDRITKCSCGWKGTLSNVERHIKAVTRQASRAGEDHHVLIKGIAAPIPAPQARPAAPVAPVVEETPYGAGIAAAMEMEAEKDTVFAVRERALLDKVKARLATELPRPEVVAPPAPVAAAVAPPPEPMPTAKPAKTVKAKAERKPVDTKWVKIGAGTLLALIGFAIIAYLYSMNPKIPLFVSGIPLVAVGTWIIIRSWNATTTNYVTAAGNVGGPPVKGKPVPSNVQIAKPSGAENCLNIYPPRMGGARFEYIETPPQGLPQKCDNDNRWYYVNIWDEKRMALTALVLPDTKYYDPKEFANIFDAEPIRRFFEIRFGTLERLAPLMFLGMMGIAILAILILPSALKGDPNKPVAQQTSQVVR
jgi:hypothetical protein